MKLISSLLLLAFICGLYAFSNTKRPYECGPVYKKRDVKDFREVVSFINPVPGEVIANVGAINGYETAMMAVFTDGVTYYIQDLDTICLNYFELDKVLNYYSDFKGESLKLSNQFYITIGTKEKTGLSESFYHKIYSNMAFHTFENPEMIVKDIHKSLKPGGQLFIRDGFSQNHNEFPCPETGCQKPYISYDDFMNIMESNEFGLTEKIDSYGEYPIYKFGKE